MRGKVSKMKTDNILHMTEADIQNIPTEAHCRVLLGECWECITDLQQKLRLLQNRRSELWRQENSKLIKQHDADKLTENLIRYLKQNQFIK